MSCRQVLRVHKSALYAQRSFWKVLLHSNVTFTALVHAFKRIENCRARADRAYQTVLERYPTNVKVGGAALVKHSFALFAGLPFVKVAKPTAAICWLWHSPRVTMYA